MRDANYPWFILVPKRAGVSEIFQLSEAEQRQLWQESALLSQAIMTAFGGDKLNIAALGNIVPQLHVHHVVRHRSDASWPAPVWGAAPRKPYDEEALQARLATTRHILGQPFASAS